MGNRLSKIVTRTGDDGTTGLASGDRIRKDHIRMEAMGTVDELNCFVGSFIDVLAADSQLRPIFSQIQNDLFDLGGELAMPDYTMIGDAHCLRLEEHVEALNEPLQPLKDFILPAGSEALSRCHIVRAVARRAERRMVELSATDTVNANARKYLNRLSDLAFVSARWLAHEQGEPEVLWQPSKVAEAD